MNSSLLLLGRSSGLLGLALCLISGITRLAGVHWLAGFETLTILQAGIGGMVLGCFCLLLVLTQNGGNT
ncbi:MAG: hypothetical protein IPJ12_06785 [Betaproteobacteria bacterium]|jgi:hypothetical protein|nr:hypothetical protein [Betaproteobacteria bacterium]